MALKVGGCGIAWRFLCLDWSPLFHLENNPWVAEDSDDMELIVDGGSIPSRDPDLGVQRLLDISELDPDPDPDLNTLSVLVLDMRMDGSPNSELSGVVCWDRFVNNDENLFFIS